jgi:prepilin-type N-terminal cleavage/methylation domain-containing protein
LNRVRRLGYSLAEVLVVVGIIGVLLGILAPAVQLVRESAHCARCGNNLRQMVMAVHHADATWGRLPPAWGAYPSVRQPVQTPYGVGSLFFHLLPELGHGALYQSAHMTHPTVAPAGAYNSATRESRVAEFVCPSDPTNDQPGLGSYAANEQVFRRFVEPKSLALGIPDGLTHTIFIAELLGRCSNGNGGTAEVYWALDLTMYFVDNFPERRRTPHGGAGFFPATPHQRMQLGMGDGSVRGLELPVSAIVWYALTLPYDGRTGEQ